MRFSVWPRAPQNLLRRVGGEEVGGRVSTEIRRSLTNRSRVHRQHLEDEVQHLSLKWNNKKPIGPKKPGAMAAAGLSTSCQLDQARPSFRKLRNTVCRMPPLR